MKLVNAFYVSGFKPEVLAVKIARVTHDLKKWTVCSNGFYVFVLSDEQGPVEIVKPEWYGVTRINAQEFKALYDQYYTDTFKDMERYLNECS